MYTFTKSERLCKKQLTKKVFSDGVSLKSDCFRIIYSEAFSQQEKLKIQIVVPKKIVTKAVDRNFIKRQIRESFRKNKSQIPNLDVVVLIRKGIDVLPNVVISSKMNSLWNDLCAKSAEQPNRTNSSVIGT